MSPAAKLAGFATVLAVLFGGGAAAGSLVDADAPGGTTGAEPVAAGHGGMGGAGQAAMVRGLSVAENGLRLVVEDADLRRDRTKQLRFRIVGGDGRAVRDFDVEHTKRMHLIVARRDLGTFQHLHPTMGADGTWTAPVRLPDAGSYRVFADFSHAGEPTTLASDLRVDGDAALEPLPAPATVAKSDGGYDVRLDGGGTAPAGRESELRFTVTRAGRSVAVEPYLGADGHLVALREGDLAFLHVHPDHRDGDSIDFETTFPTTGRYRLFLQFKHEGRVQTVAFTQEVK